MSDCPHCGRHLGQIDARIGVCLRCGCCCGVEDMEAEVVEDEGQADA